MKTDVIYTTLIELSLVIMFSIMIIYNFQAINMQKQSTDENAKCTDKINAEKDKFEKYKATSGSCADIQKDLEKCIGNFNETQGTHNNCIRNLKEIEEKYEKAKKDIETLERKLIDLKSKIKPSCMEIGFSASFLAVVTINGSNAYSLNNYEVDYNQLSSHFKNELDSAKNKNCVHSIDVIANSNVTLQEYHDGLKKLETIFYVRRIGIKR